MHKRKLHLAANWKMNHSLSSLKEYATSFKKSFHYPLDEICKFVDITFCVPSLFLLEAKNIFALEKINFAAQNVFFEEKGAFTGEISSFMLKDAGIHHTLLGHSERRSLFYETDELVHKKLQTFIKNNLKVVLCLGESKEERLSNKTNTVLEHQLETALVGVKSMDNLSIAYEPVWAIGTGLTASCEQAQDAHAFIRRFIVNKFGEDQARSVQILYGGSMKPEVTKELLSMEDVDGGLVGGASLDPTSFAKMIEIAYLMQKN